MTEGHDPRNCRVCRAALRSHELQPHGRWHICDGPATKSPLWRFGSWLIGLSVVLAGIAVSSVLTGFGTWELLATPLLWVLLIVGFAITAPHAIARLRGRGIYLAPADSMKMRPQEITTVIWNLLLWRSFLSIGDGIATWAWNAALPGTPLSPHRGEDPTDAYAQHR